MGHAKTYDIAYALQWPSDPGRGWLRHVVRHQWDRLDQETRVRVAFSLVSSGRIEDERLIRTVVDWSSMPSLHSAKTFASRRPKRVEWN